MRGNEALRCLEQAQHGLVATKDSLKVRREDELDNFVARDALRTGRVLYKREAENPKGF
ncbi:MAG: hypothetical protein ABIN54_09635 [candidate division WOR-3 bacterium]